MREVSKAPTLDYHLPNSTSYNGRNYIILRHPKLDEGSDWWK